MQIEQDMIGRQTNGQISPTLFYLVPLLSLQLPLAFHLAHDLCPSLCKTFDPSYQSNFNLSLAVGSRNIHVVITLRTWNVSLSLETLNDFALLLSIHSILLDNSQCVPVVRLLCRKEGHQLWGPATIKILCQYLGAHHFPSTLLVMQNPLPHLLKPKEPLSQRNHWRTVM